MLDVLVLLLVLVVARACGEGATRLGQTGSVGELLAGIGLALLAVWLGDWVPVLPALTSNEILGQLAQLGIFFLVLQAGIEMEPSEIAERSAGALPVALGGIVLPLGLGVLLGWWFLPAAPEKTAQALLIGVALSITAIPATVKVLGDFGLLHRRVGETVVSAAIFDDVFGLFLLAVLTAVIQTGQLPAAGDLLILLLKVAVFFGITVTLGVHVYPRAHRGLRTMQAAALELSALIAVAIAYGLLAEALGIHWIMGAFMAGLFFEKSRVGAQAYGSLKLIVGAISGGILAPLFFVWIGLQVAFTGLGPMLPFLGALIAAGFFGKVVGAGAPALMLGYSRRDAAVVGVGMTSRGAVELVVLSIALEAGLLTQNAGLKDGETPLFSILVVTAVVNTLLMPLVLGRLCKPERAPTRAPRRRPD